MITFPNAKINLGLHVLRKRTDGYHDIETIFYPVKYFDILEIVEISKLDMNIEYPGIKESLVKISETVSIHFLLSGLKVEGTGDENLCIKAIKLFNNSYPIMSNYLVHLHKKIPMGAGLGGGSSDAAQTLLILNELNGQPATFSELLQMAELTGSDCPFFLKNKPVIATGRGELMEDIETSLSDFKIVIITPPVFVATAAAFNKVIPNESHIGLKEIVNKPFNEWQKNLKNNFETPVFELYPEIEKIKKELMNCGALYASLSGSGSSVYGLFKENLPGAEKFKGSAYFWSSLN